MAGRPGTDRAGSGALRTDHIGTAGIRTDPVGTGGSRTDHLDTGGSRTDPVDTGESRTDHLDTGGSRTNHVGTGGNRTNHVGTGGNRTDHVGTGSNRTRLAGTGGSRTACGDTGRFRGRGRRVPGIRPGGTDPGGAGRGRSGPGMARGRAAAECSGGSLGNVSGQFGESWTTRRSCLGLAGRAEPRPHLGCPVAGVAAGLDRTGPGRVVAGNSRGAVRRPWLEPAGAGNDRIRRDGNGRGGHVLGGRRPLAGCADQRLADVSRVAVAGNGRLDGRGPGRSDLRPGHDPPRPVDRRHTRRPRHLAKRHGTKRHGTRRDRPRLDRGKRHRAKRDRAKRHLAKRHPTRWPRAGWALRARRGQGRGWTTAAGRLPGGIPGRLRLRRGRAGGGR
ncbi:hypothetical protein SAMN05421541_101162 [Actinoplanes philippinensis]|uniref:Uncharacterized protein n=1 Tax=Actinoplanes philippinensis TaxID=35752 RepID=A0A1I1ZLV1_9ACTN|nr:hypothetical protein SAMN05421541_101162 [Actinoplanes philippinensis]